MIVNSLWDELNYTVRAFFVAEFLIKITGIGIHSKNYKQLYLYIYQFIYIIFLIEFLKNLMNIIDMLSVYYSIIEIIADYNSNFFSDIDGINVLRYFRFLRILLVLRILKLCIKLEYMNFILGVIQKSLYSFIVIIGMFFLVISFYALIGRSSLAPYYIQQNPQLFNTFGNSFITTFIIITMDNWYVLLTAGVNDSESLMKISSFIVSIIFLGNFIFLNLFLAVLLDAFEKENTRLKLELENDNIYNINEIDDEEPVAEDNNYRKFMHVALDDSPRAKKTLFTEKESVIINNVNGFIQQDESFMNSIFQEFNNNKSLLIFGSQDALRLIAIKIVSHEVFHKICQGFVIFQVFLTVLLSFQLKNEFTIYLNIGMYIFFSVEAILKIISKGLLMETDAYLLSYSNFINFVAVIGFYLKTIYFAEDSIVAVIFSIFQACVPLRILETNKKLRKIVLSFWQSLEEIANVVIALLLVWFIISIWGVNLFRDRFGYCETPDNFIGINQVYI